MLLSSSLRKYTKKKEKEWIPESALWAQGALPGKLEEALEAEGHGKGHGYRQDSRAAPTRCFSSSLRFLPPSRARTRTRSPAHEKGWGGFPGCGQDGEVTHQTPLSTCNPAGSSLPRLYAHAPYHHLTVQDGLRSGGRSIDAERGFHKRLRWLGWRLFVQEHAFSLHHWEYRLLSSLGHIFVECLACTRRRTRHREPHERKDRQNPCPHGRAPPI